MSQTISVNQDEPQNSLERRLSSAKAGKIPVDEFLRQVLSSELFITSTREIKEDGSGFAPLLYDRNGVPMTAVFTSFSRAASKAEIAKYVLQINGRELFDRLPSGYGIVLNPGFTIGMEILPHGVKEIVWDLG